jgi:hypothetical protein
VDSVSKGANWSHRIVIFVATVAGVASFAHVIQAAHSHGQPWSLAWLYPFTTDALVIAGYLELRKRTLVRLWPARLALVLGVLGSGWANWMDVEPGAAITSRAVSVWPVLIFLVTVHVVTGKRKPPEPAAAPVHSSVDEGTYQPPAAAPLPGLVVDVDLARTLAVYEDEGHNLAAGDPWTHSTPAASADEAYTYWTNHYRQQASADEPGDLKHRVPDEPGTSPADEDHQEPPEREDPGTDQGYQALIAALRRAHPGWTQMQVRAALPLNGDKPPHINTIKKYWKTTAPPINGSKVHA